MAGYRIPVYINPLRLFEWDRVRVSWNLPEDPTPERLLEFLCPLSEDATLPGFKRRYQDLDDPNEPSLFFQIEDAALRENIFGPLRAARTSYVAANYLIENRLARVVLFLCPACGDRWSADEPGTPKT